jgi:hypothetical protein
MKRALIEVIFDKDIQNFARDKWDILESDLNKLLGLNVGWDFSTGYSAVGSFKGAMRETAIKLLAVGSQVGPFKIESVRVA